MRKQFYLLGCLALMLGASACQNDMEELVNEPEIAITNPEKVEMTFTAQFDENALTRTQLDGTRVKWTADDKIKVYPMADKGYYSPADFTTSEGGLIADFTGSFSSGIIDKATGFYAIFPSTDVTFYTNPLIAFDIPAVQQATPNSYAEGLNVSYAYTKDINGRLTFRNTGALIGFKLKGTGAKSIKRIRFNANQTSSSSVTYITGTTHINLSDGSLSGVYSGNSYVELEGSFNTTDTYYMVVAPVDLDNGFSMSFFDSSGKEYLKKGLNRANLQSSHILDLGTIEVNSGDIANGTVTTFQSSTKSKPVPLVVIPEGFTKNQMTDFHNKAEEMLDFLFEVDPYKQYRAYFNVYIIDAASNEEGADVYDKSVNKDTFFDAGWSQDSYSDMSANGELIYSFVSSHCPDILNGKATINETAVIMIINDERYGGICHTTSLGRGYAMVPVTKGGGDMNWAGNEKAYGTTNIGTWKNTALHEGGGHMFGRLADEYWSNYQLTATDLDEHLWDLPYAMNVTVDKDNKVYWSHMIPTTQGVKENKKFLYVGVYEGGYARYRLGVWRSEEVSCMDDNRAYYSAWQRYLIAKRIHDIADEEFDYEAFISQDDQYLAIQAGYENRGKEGLITTTYNGLTPNFDASKTRANYVEADVKIYPPLPPPVLTEIKEPEISLEELKLIE